MKPNKELLNNLINYTKNNENNKEEISKIEQIIAENIKDYIDEESFLNELPFENIYNIFKDIDYENNALPTSTIKVVIQKLNKRDSFKSFSLLMFLSQPYSTLGECVSLLSNFTQSPLLMQLSLLYHEISQSLQLDYDYELQLKDNIINHLKKELLDMKFPPITDKPSRFEPDIHKAAHYGQLKSIQYLLEKDGVSPNLLNDKGCSPLIIAAQYGHLQIVQYLIERHNADMNIHDKLGQSALMYSAYCGKLPIVQYLIEVQGANPNETDYDGLSLLHLAAQGNNMDVIKYLVEHVHMKFDIKAINGETPYKIASKYHYTDICRYLKQQGGEN